MILTQSRLDEEPSNDLFLIPCQIVEVEIVRSKLPTPSNVSLPDYITVKATFRRKDTGTRLTRSIYKERMRELAALKPNLWSSPYPAVELRRLQKSWCVLALDGDERLLGIFTYEDFCLPPEPEPEKKASPKHSKRRRRLKKSPAHHS